MVHPPSLHQGRIVPWFCYLFFFSLGDRAVVSCLTPVLLIAGSESRAHVQPCMAPLCKLCLAIHNPDKAPSGLEECEYPTRQHLKFFMLINNKL